MKLIELKIDEDLNLKGVDAISLVEHPAIEENWITLAKEEEYKCELVKVDDEKRLLMGIILIPDKPIYRNNKMYGEHHIFFSKETVRQCMYSYLKNNLQSSTTIQHKEALKDLTLVETWIVEDLEKDKTALYNINATVGCWAGTFKVDNDDVWNNEIKTGNVKGFSIEGFFKDIPKIEMNEEDQKEIEALNTLEQIKKIIEDETSK